MAALYFSTNTGTTFGSARVEVSPILSSSPAAIFLNILLMILPDLVFGRSANTMKSSGSGGGSGNGSGNGVVIVVVESEFY